jgi:hypothetical protein
MEVSETRDGLTDATTAHSTRHDVIPANAGISVCDRAAGEKTEVPAFAGMTRWVGPHRKSLQKRPHARDGNSVVPNGP